MSLFSCLVIGYFFHYRYWTGTIRAVQDTEVSVIRNLLSADFSQILAEKNYSVFENIFFPYKNKLFVEIVWKDEVIFQNRQQDRMINILYPDTLVKVDNNVLTFKFASYLPPYWLNIFFEWIKNPSNFRKYDRIYFIFFPFLALWYLIFVVMFFYLRARYQRKLLINVLEVLEVDEESKDKIFT